MTASGIFDYNNRLICLSPRRIKGGRSKCVSRHFRRPDQFELNELSFVMQTTSPSEYITGSKQSITLKLLKYFFFYDFDLVMFLIDEAQKSLSSLSYFVELFLFVSGEILKSRI